MPNVAIPDSLAEDVLDEKAGWIFT